MGDGITSRRRIVGPPRRKEAANGSQAPSRAPVSWPAADLAARASARLQEPRRTERDPESLASALAVALRKKDDAALRDLASPTHFSIGLGGGEREFVDYEKFAPLLSRALAKSNVKVDPERLTGAGEKRNLETGGWSEAPLRAALPADSILEPVVRRNLHQRVPIELRPALPHAVTAKAGASNYKLTVTVGGKPLRNIDVMLYLLHSAIHF